MERNCSNCRKELSPRPIGDGFWVKRSLCDDCLGKAMNIPVITLKRVHSNMYRTFGVLMDQQGPFAVTLEDPWNANRRNVSCIPPGNYICQRVVSPKFGNTFEVKRVPDRSHILFHVGNTEENTHGCILVGHFYGDLDGRRAVLDSRTAFRDFMDRMKCKDRFLLRVEE